LLFIPEASLTHCWHENCSTNHKRDHAGIKCFVDFSRCPVDSSYVVISPDRLQMTINLPPGTGIQPGQTVMLQLPSTTPAGDPIFYPNHLATTPCQFTVTAVAALPAVVPVVPVAAAAAAGISPLAIIIGVLVVGVGVAAAAGAFRAPRKIPNLMGRAT